MYRLALLCAVLLAGCQTTAPDVDPFLGRKTVPPPGTGDAGGVPPDVYYPGQPGAAPAYSPDGTSPSSPYAPPGGSYQYQQGSLPQGPAASLAGRRQGEPTLAAPLAQDGPEPAVLAVASTDNEAAPIDDQSGEFADDGSQVRLASHASPLDEGNRPLLATPATSEIRIIPPVDASDGPGSPPAASGVTGSSFRSRPAASNVAGGSQVSAEPAHLGSPDAVDIMQLPRVRRASREVPAATAGHVASRPDSSASESEPVGSGDRYARAADYRWLRGQLEYSLMDRQWKLRYIPIDGDTDDYGGSVVLEGLPAEDFRPGEFVSVHGEISGDTPAGTFAAPYRVDEITPLSR